MKKLLSFLFLLSVSFISAQPYLPMLQEGNAWSVDVYWSNFGGQYWIETQQISISGTIEINGETYHRMFNNDGESCYVREENEKIYLFNDLNNSEFILYDFTLNVGNTFSLPHEDLYTCTYGYGSYRFQNATVTNVSTQFIAGANRKVIEFDFTAPLFGQEIWIEGIGSIRGIAPGGDFEADGIQGTNLACFTQNGETTYFNDATQCDNTTLNNPDNLKSRITLYPNPVKKTSILQFPAEAAIDRLKIYNLSGKLIRDEIISEKHFKINAMNYASGLYFYQVFSENKLLKTGKFIVQ
jgi:hypothetical protein